MGNLGNSGWSVNIPLKKHTLIQIGLSVVWWIAPTICEGEINRGFDIDYGVTNNSPAYVGGDQVFSLGSVVQMTRLPLHPQTSSITITSAVVAVWGQGAGPSGLSPVFDSLNAVFVVAVCDSLPQLGNGIPFARQAIFTPNNYTHTPLTGYTNQYGYPVYSVSVNFSNLLGAIPTGGSNVYFGFQFGNTTWSTGGGMVGGMTGTNGFQAFPYGSQPTTPGRDFAFKIKGFSTVNLESPQLTISSLSNEQLQINWPLASDGEFRLQTATNLSPDAVWTDVTYSISTNGAWRSVIFPPTQSSHFFRLSYY